MPFIKLHHAIFLAGLSPTAFCTYCGILRFMNSVTSYANVSMAKLAAGACISERSAHRGVQELLARGLVRLVKKFDRDGFRLANGYQVAPSAAGSPCCPWPPWSSPSPLAASWCIAISANAWTANSRRSPVSRGSPAPPGSPSTR